MRVVEGDIEEERPVVLSLQELPDQQFHPRDVPPHLEDGVILLRVREVKRVHGLWSHVLLPNDACANTSSAQQQRQALHPVKGVEVVDVLVQAIHSVLMLGQASEEAGTAGRAAADRGEGIAEDNAAAGQGVQVRVVMALLL